MSSRFSSNRPLTPREEAEIQRMIASDPDAPEATDEELAKATPFAEVFPALAESMKRGRGRPTVDNPKKLITLRLDQAVIDKFEATGKGWRSRMNDALKAAKV